MTRAAGTTMRTMQGWLGLVTLGLAACTAANDSTTTAASKLDSSDACGQSAPASGVTIYPLGSSLASVAPGSTFEFTIDLAYVGPPLGDDYGVFLHLVGADQPDWFKASVYPVPGPKSSTWNGHVTFHGSLAVPADASGTYRLMAGVHHDGGATESPNIRLTPGAPAVGERFGNGAIGYRYEIGTLNVGATAANPSASPSRAWAQSIIDDMTLASEETTVARGTGTANASAPLASIGMTGGGYASIAGICQGICDHFTSLVSNAISWTWVWAGANHRAQHTLVLARRARGYYLTGDGRWVEAFTTRPSGEPERIDTDTAIESGLPDTQAQVDALTTSLKPDAYYKYELWGGADVGHAAFQNARAWFFSTDLSVVPDGSGIDDRADSDFIVKVGADFSTSEVVPDTDHPNWRARYIDVSTGKLTAATCGTCYPYSVADGFGGRYRKIPTDGAWITVTAIAMAPTFGGSGLPPPWGNYSTPSPWAQPPYVLTADEISSNPPPP